MKTLFFLFMLFVLFVYSAATTILVLVQESLAMGLAVLIGNSMYAYGCWNFADIFDDRKTKHYRALIIASLIVGIVGFIRLSAE